MPDYRFFRCDADSFGFWNFLCASVCNPVNTWRNLFRVVYSLFQIGFSKIILWQNPRISDEKNIDL